MADLEWSKTEIFVLVIMIVVGIMLILQIVFAVIVGNLAKKISKPIDDASKFVKDVINSIPEDTRADLSALAVEVSKDFGELANAGSQYLKLNAPAFKSLLSETTAMGVQAIKDLPNIPTTIEGVQKLGALSSAAKPF